MILVSLAACNNTRSSMVDPNNREFSTPDDSMLLVCSKLKGLGPLVIDSTTFKMALKEEIFKGISDFEKKSDFSGSSGQWAVGYDKADLVNESKNIKRLYIMAFQIGEIPFFSIEMAFYKDTLCAMNIDPENMDGLINHYISEYGTGNGYRNIIDEEKRKIFSFDEQRRWYNERLEMEYKNEFQMLNGEVVSGTKYLLMKDLTGRYGSFKAELDSLKNRIKEPSYDGI